MNRKRNKLPYSLFNQYCLRTAIFPLDFYIKLHKREKISDTDLQELLDNKIIQEAIYLASPDLFLQLKNWQKGHINEQKKIQRIRFSFLKYLTRMSTRCTPFGLFASCTIGEFSNDKSSISLQPVNNYRKSTHFDEAFSAMVLGNLTADSQLRHKLLYYPNSSLYKIADQYRYVEYSIQENKREYVLQSVKSTDYLEKLITSAAKGKRIATLSKELIMENFSEDDSLAFIESLIANQILVSEIEPTVTGKTTFQRIINENNQVLKNDPVFLAFQKNSNELKQIEKQIGTPVEKYETIQKSFRDFLPNLSTKHLFQVNLFSETRSAHLNQNLKDSLREAFSVLNKITPPKPNGLLEKFKKDFTRRYGQQEIDMTKALDPEIGIGYGIERNDVHPFLENIHFPIPKEKSQNVSWDPFDDVLLPSVITALKNDQKKIILTKKDFGNIKENWNDLSPTLSSIIEIYKYNDQEKIYMNSAAGPSAANLLARFCLGSEEINKYVENIIQTEEKNSPDKIFAEIVHLPQVRMGNILRRPTFRKYEIPYLAKSGLPKEFQIPIQDLMLSVKNDRIILRSKKLKKEIIPCHTNAYNYSLDPLPIYHFLCDLQTQNQRTAIGFQWNSLFKKFGFLPRIEYENIILAKATWNIASTDLKEFLQFENKKLLKKILLWREKLQLPQQVQLIEGDNKLLIDFENFDSVQMFLKSAKTKEVILLEEFLFDDEGFVKKGKERFCNQFVISFFRNENFSE